MTTNAERQAEFKAKMRKQGLALVAEWIPEKDRAKFKAYAKQLREGTAADPAPEPEADAAPMPRFSEAERMTSNAREKAKADAKRKPKPDRSEATAKAKATRERKQRELRRAYDEGEPVAYFDQRGNSKEGRLLKRGVRHSNMPGGHDAPPAAITEVLIESSKGSVLKRVFAGAWSGDLRLDLDREIPRLRKRLKALHPDTGAETADPVAFQAAKDVLDAYRRLAETGPPLVVE